MSTFIWGKIQFNALPQSFKSYKRGDILVFFDIQQNDLYMADLEDREIYFHIACGYEEMVSLHKYNGYYLNCNDHYFFPNVPKRKRREKPEHDYQFYVDQLYDRIKKLQDVIVELFERPEVEKVEYYHTDTGNENSIDEYEPVDWPLNEFADKFFEAMNDNYGFTPTIKAVFEKTTSM